MIAWTFATAILTVDTRCTQTRQQRVVHEQEVHAETLIARERVPIDPLSVDALVGEEVERRVGPSLLQQAFVCIAALRL